MRRHPYMLIIVFITLTIMVSIGQSLKNKYSSAMLMRKLLKEYEKGSPPESPTVVQLGIYINSFYDISEQTMDYSLNMYLRQQWKDPRLTFNPIDNNNSSKMKLGDGMLARIWTPDVFFRNEKKASFHDVTTPNRHLNLHSDGTLWYASKITATLGCPMRLHKYPHDSQSCPMMFESFGYTMEHIVFKWLPSAVQFKENLELPQFRLFNVTLNDCSQNFSTGGYPCLEVNFLLAREIGYYMIQLYVPSVLIVILSWVAFWIRMDAIIARVTIGLLSVLTMTIQSAGARTSLPRVSYIKAIDVWISVCLIFVFTSLVELAVVDVFLRKDLRQRRCSSFRKYPQTPREEKIALEQFNKVTHKEGNLEEMQEKFVRDTEGRHKARQINKFSQKLFPLAFLSFNLIYWLAYILG